MFGRTRGNAVPHYYFRPDADSIDNIQMCDNTIPALMTRIYNLNKNSMAYYT